MSMRDYAVNEYGLLLDEETIKLIASKVFDDFVDNDEEYGDWSYELYDMGICEHISEFSGEAQAVNNDGYVDWGGEYESFSGDSIAYVSLLKYPTLFRKAYDNMEEIVESFKEEESTQRSLDIIRKKLNDM